MTTALDLLARRMSGETSDGARLALVVEGGGMRGVISAAMAAALEEIGATRHFDLFVGTSAGATNTLAAACGRSRALSDLYPSAYVSRDLIDPRNLLRGRPVVHGQRVIDVTMESLGLDTRIRDVTAPVALVATRLSDGVAVPLTQLREAGELAGALLASCALPLVGGPPVVHAGERWLDGGVSEAIPVRAAASLGATHAIVLATRPDGAAPGRGPMDRLIERYLGRHGDEIAAAYRARPERYAADRAAMTSGELAGVRTAVLAPGPHDPIPSRTERDAARIRITHDAAYRRAFELLRGAGLLDDQTTLTNGA
ncbi:patatin-like phospholipase family protein [Nocardioides jiangxiensis]|uniref:Patatin-like phospholipase family protein n=1 Tax=Nocardioides jiangxiensis TaxID=3064524 RepID=A0ABT9B574_9ACTN|nr:patatin-like phospholipase family protein [Nocardioides sp. WY-20]MDO7869459.1 patatin-like phospholipase family protein [Nocardioides sp. WY-20]